MIDISIVLALTGLTAATWALIRRRSASRARRRSALAVIAGGFLTLLVAAAVAEPPLKQSAQTTSSAASIRPHPSTSTTDAPSQGVPPGAQPAVVERIVDGDTLWVRVDRPGSGPLPPDASHAIRLLEIDTPETKAPGKPVECYGPEATRFAEHTLPPGSHVWLTADKQDRDRYGRFLRYLWTDHGLFFNHEAARQGFARAVLYPPNDAHINEIRAAEADARAAKRGMWGACNY